MPETRESFRSAVLQLEQTGNGRTLTGLAVPYGQFAEIVDMRGHYQEMIAPGAFTDALRNGRPRMFFEHGLDPRTGKTPIGSYDRVWEDSDGVHVSGQLFDNQLTKPLIDAARSGDLASWSAHFRTPADGSWENWERAKGWNVRTVNRAELPEISLVNKGAYQTTLSIRSSFDQFSGRPDAAGSGVGENEYENDPFHQTQAALRARDRALRIQGII